MNGQACTQRAMLDDDDGGGEKGRKKDVTM